MQRSAMLLAAALSVGGFALTAQGSPPPLSSNAGADSAVVHLVNRALEQGDMHRLIVNFPASDMRHIMASSGYSNGYGKDLNARIERICVAWQHHYGHGPDAKGLRAALAGDFAAIDSSDGHGITVDIGAAKQPQVKLHLVRDAGMWSISVPDSMTADRLRANLYSQFAVLDGSASSWPASETSAYDMLTRAVASAVSDAPSRTAASVAAPKTATASATPAPGTNSKWWKFWRNW